MKQEISLSQFSLFLLFCIAASVPVDSTGDQAKGSVSRLEATRPLRVCEHQYVTEVDYAITTVRFYNLDNSKTGWVEKCVFHPIYPTGVCPKSSQEGITRSALSFLKSYRVYSRDGQLLDRKYAQFDMVETDLHGYPASDVPPGGCGDFLVTGEGKVVTGQLPRDLGTFIETLKQKEKQFFTAELRRLPDWVTEEQRRDIAKHDLKETYEESKKSDIGTFYDGREWYLVRSYWTGIPTTLNVFMLYQIEPTRNRLHPQLVFLSTARGEGYLSLGYFGAFDLRNDGTNDLIVEVSGHEYFYFAQIRRHADGWRFR